jgi:hypothetical protein
VSILVTLLAVIILPAITYYTGLATSGAAGTTAVAALLMFSTMQYLVREDWSSRQSRLDHRLSPTVLLLAILAFVVAHAAFAWAFLPFDPKRAGLSIAPLSMIILAGCCLGNMLQDATNQDVDRAIRYCFLFFCLCALGGILGLSPPSAWPTAKPVFPFNEPSYIGVIFTPFLIFCCVRSRGLTRYAIWTVGLLIAASLENFTLVVGCGLAALAFVRGIAVFPLLVLAGGAGLVVDLSYYLSRVDFSSDNQNLSALVYIQGWQLIGESLAHSFGWGLGFQQLGLQGTDVPAAELIFAQVQDNLNLFDGGFNLAKLVSEFGVFGLGLSLVFLKLWWRSMRRLRLVATGAEADAAEVFAMSVVAGYFIELFLRGEGGYFTASGLLLIAALWLMTARNKKAAAEHAVEAEWHPSAGSA